MALIYDSQGNPQRILAAQGGDTISDIRTAAILGAFNAETVIAIAQESTAIIDVRGTFAATLIAEISFDGTNYVQYPIFNPLTEAYVVGISAAGHFMLEVPGGAKTIRIRCSAYTSGAAIAVFRAASASEFIYAKDLPASMISATGVAAAAVVLTIPSAGAGLSNYLGMLQIAKFSASILTPGVSPVLVTTTGIIGNPTFSFPADASAQGLVVEQLFQFPNPVKGNATNTALTVSCPATPGIIWRVNAAFYIGA